MSERPPARPPHEPPRDPVDGEIAEAFAALDRTIGVGQTDDFVSRLDARLSQADREDRMEGSKLGTSGRTRDEELKDQVARARGAGAAAAPAERDEHSGLHEIKALASSTKQRISRQSSVPAIDDETLLSASGSMRAVALPDPRKERRTSQSELTATATATPTAEASARMVAQPSSRRTGAMLALALFVAAAAAVAAVVVLKNRDGGATPGAAGDVMARNDVPPAAPSSAPASAPAVAPLEEETVSGEAGPAGAAAMAAASPSVEPLPAAELQPEGERNARRDEGRSAARVVRGAEDDRSAKETRASRDKDDRAEKAEIVAAAKGGATSPPPRPTGGEGQSVDDILDSMSGGAPKAPAAESKPEAARPSKKSLDRRDVSSAMGSIREEARSCYGVEQFAGTVSVKFTVDPSGKIASATATGKHAGTPTGTCVADAVKGARFPAFDGAATSFTFPFLLSE
jgi:hypothetical protein